ncbi:MAG: hypothetical protein OEZ10_03620 [Gammaproteobacteria bacterium]|nr:hypothetical protein [Gammaproteobacteria bacterium]
MKLWLLLLTALFVFILGYRFFAKLLLITLFAPVNMTDQQEAAEPGIRHARLSPLISFGHFTVTLMGIGVVPGIGVAMIWGWVPAYLWLVAGTTTFGAIYLMGALWLSQRPGSPGLIDSSRLLLGDHAAAIMRALRYIILAGLCAWLLWLGAWLLTRHPSISWVAIGQFLAAFWLRHHWTRRGELYGRSGLITHIAVMILGAIALLAIGQVAGISFGGTIEFKLGGHPRGSLGAMTLWGALLLAASLTLGQQRYHCMIRGRSWLAGVLIATVMLILTLGLAIKAPVMNAPEFYSNATTPGRYPWLFLVLSGGAFAGFYALFAQPLAALQLRHIDDQRRWGFGAVSLIAIIALLFWAVLTTAQTNLETWHAWVDQGQPWIPLESLMTQVISQGGYLISGLGISQSAGGSLIALAMLFMTIAGLDTCILMTTKETQALATPRLGRWISLNYGKVALLAGSLVMLALLLFLSAPASLAWLLFGIAGMMLAGCVFGLISLQIGQKSRIWPAMAMAALAAWLTGFWGLMESIAVWWTLAPAMLLPAIIITLLSASFIGLVLHRIIQHLQKPPVPKNTE